MSEFGRYCLRNGCFSLVNISWCEPVFVTLVLKFLFICVVCVVGSMPGWGSGIFEVTRFGDKAKHRGYLVLRPNSTILLNF